jgi:hypothetical protein
MPIVRASLDEEAVRQISALATRLGWTRSQVLREGIRVLAAVYPAARKRTISGIGQFTSHIQDLGSEKAHLKGFGC